MDALSFLIKNSKLFSKKAVSIYAPTSSLYWYVLHYIPIARIRDLYTYTYIVLENPSANLVGEK